MPRIMKKVFDLLIREHYLFVYTGHASPRKATSSAPEFPPDGSLILSGNGYGLHVWDITIGQLIGIIEEMQPWGEIMFSADQRLVSISGAYGVFSVWGIPHE